MKISSFLSELKQRKVIRAAMVYVVVAWAIMEGGALILDALGLPAWTVTLLVVFAILGFPLVLVLAWAYDLTPDGLQRDRTGKAGNGDDGAPLAPQPPAAVAVDRGRFIAVLPFNDMSEKQDQVHFCEGIAEEILNALSKIEDLRVASRMSSFHFGARSADIQEVGRKLNVGAVLEGSVRKSGEHMRITAQLVNTADGYHLWSQSYDFRLEDVFQIQEEIAASIASTLRLTMKRTATVRSPKVSPQAYDFYLRGLGYFARHSAADTIYARQMFQRAIDIEPGFGKAWAGLAYTYGFEYMYFNAASQSREEALRSSARALELAPDLPESHVSSGIAHCMSRAFQEADVEFQTALKLDPGSFEAWYFYGRDQGARGRSATRTRAVRRGGPCPAGRITRVCSSRHSCMSAWVNRTKPSTSLASDSSGRAGAWNSTPMMSVHRISAPSRCCASARKRRPSAGSRDRWRRRHGIPSCITTRPASMPWPARPRRRWTVSSAA